MSTRVPKFHHPFCSRLTTARHVNPPKETHVGASEQVIIMMIFI